MPSETLILNPEERREAVLDVIRSARRRVVLSIFRCTDFKVIDELAAAASRGAKVSLLLTREAKGWKQRLQEMKDYLESMGAEVLRYSGPARKYHAKYVAVDDGPALVASLNFTHKCFTSSCDFIVVTHDPEVVGGLQRLFEFDCKTPAKALPAELADGRLIIGPDRTRARFTQMLKGARHSIRIIDHKVQDPAIVRLLAEKEEDGVSVTVLGRGQAGGLHSHGKMMLIDESCGAIGSIALSTASLDTRREVAILIHDPDSVARLNEFFLNAERGTLDMAPVRNGAAGDDDEDDDE